MPITIRNYNGTIRTQVDDNLVDSASTSIQFVGKGWKPWGQPTQESLMWLLQNFENTSSPLNPIKGQLWYDSRPEVMTLKVFNGTEWVFIGSAIIASSENPPVAGEGQLWFDSTNKQIKVKVGNFWDIVGPLASKINANPVDAPIPSNSVIDAIQIADSATALHQCWRVIVAGMTVAIISKDPVFTPGNMTTFAGFPKIYPGINLNKDIPSVTVAGDDSVWTGRKTNLPDLDRQINIGSQSKRVGNVYTHGAVITGNLFNTGTTYFGPSTTSSKPVVFGKTDNLGAIPPRLGSIEFDGSNFFFTNMVQGTPTRQSPLFTQDLTLSRRLYVSLNGDDIAAGTTPSSAKRTIKGALAIAEAGDTIFVESGDYTEQNPLYVPPLVSIVGDNLRRTIVRPAHRKLDLFHVNNGTYFFGMTFKDHRYPAFCFAFPCSTANAIVSGGVVTTVEPMFSMTGYATAPEVLVEPPPFGGTRAVVTANSPINGGIIDVKILNPGSGFTAPPTVFATGANGSGSGAVLQAVIDNDPNSTTYQQLLSIDIVDCGVGYISPIAVAISGGTSASARATPGNGVVRSYNIVNAGSGYYRPPHISIKPPLPLPIITSSPYVQNCSSITGPFDKNGNLIKLNPPYSLTNPYNKVSPTAGDAVDISGAGGGLRIDGDVLDNDPTDGMTVIRSFVADSFTQINQGGIGHLIINRGYAQFVSCFTTFSSIGYWARSGGFCNISNSVIDFGDVGIQAEGYYPSPYETGTLSQNYTSRVGAVEMSAGGGGANYPPGQTFPVTFVGGGGAGATGTAYIGFDGRVSRVDITNQGSGYTSTPTINWLAGNSIPGGSLPRVYPTATVLLASNPTIKVLSNSGNPVEPTNSSVVKINNVFYTVISAVKTTPGTSWLVDIYPGLPSGTSGTSVQFFDVSNISTGGLALEYVGSGTTYNALPTYGGVPDPDKQVVDQDSASPVGERMRPGRIYYVTIDNTGNFKIGKFFAVNFADGSVTINSNAFNLSGLSGIGPFRRNGIPVGVFANEISNDPIMTHPANPTYDDNTIVTQYAVRQYITQISTDVVPAVPDTYNLGTGLVRWNGAYVNILDAASNATVAGNMILHTGNYTDYVVGKDGTGAFGTWAIDITGNAATATVAQNLAGAYTGPITSQQVTDGLGFTPVQQSGGTGMGTNKVYIGWGGQKLFLQVDNTPFYSEWPIDLVPTQGYQIGSLGVGTPASATQGEIRATNDITAFYSDQRLKTDIENIPDALDKVKQINGVLFKNNELAASFGYTKQDQQVGVLAQEVQKVLPQAVKLAPFDTEFDAEGNEKSKSGEEYLTVKYEKIVPLLIEAIKEMSQQIEDLKSQISKQ